MTPRSHRRTASLLVMVLAALAAVPVAVDAAIVVGTFRYEKPVDNATKVRRPIAFSRVEIWQIGPNWWNTWNKVGETTTDQNGSMRFQDPWCDGRYAVRVFASNYAAIVWPNDAVHSGPFFRQPGLPGPEIVLSPTGCNQTLDFSFLFTEQYATQHYSIAEIIRLGYDYAAARRDPRETDPLPPAGIQPTSEIIQTFYNSSTRTVAIQSADVYNDGVILHEYGHFVEHALSYFAPIASHHDGCTATDVVFGHRVNSDAHAWMEGFADYFARAVQVTAPAGAFGVANLPGTKFSGSTFTIPRLETPFAGGPCSAIGLSAGSTFIDGYTWTITPRMIELNVAAILWDLFDAFDAGTQDETFDSQMRQDVAIFQIFDRELSRLGHAPGIGEFYCAWVGRGLSRVAVDLLLEERGVQRGYCAPPFAPLVDRAIFRAPLGQWWTQVGGVPVVRTWGAPGDIPVPGYYDGDGYADLAVWRPSTGVWWILNSSGGTTATSWGQSGDTPVPGDYDGDGRTDLAVWRPSTGEWLVQYSTYGPWSQQWGQTGDVPVPGDYDRDGRTDFAVWRPSTGGWYIANSSNGSVSTERLGQWGDIPVAADYDGDGRTDCAIWRPSNGWWYAVKSTVPWWVGSWDVRTMTRQWGAPGDIPVPGDYDHDGFAEFAVWRPTGQWFVSTNGPLAAPVNLTLWGIAGDTPIAPGAKY